MESCGDELGGDGVQGSLRPGADQGRELTAITEQLVVRVDLVERGCGLELRRGRFFFVC